ncbi:DUF4166 domain-containing protein [Rhodanobacter fulvus]|nr:DUF4166 domain-containing protein [Rhodanobacter fulvus]
MKHTLPRSTSVHGLVETWFGDAFSQLHPLLQQLHRRGGTLSGPVEVRTGSGLAGWFGRRLARSLGIPESCERCAFEVQIGSNDKQMFWRRTFAGDARMLSVFEPVGAWPNGYWIEQTGAVQLRLAVEIIDGGWYWRLRQARFCGVPLPRHLLPTTAAWKRTENGRYRFQVQFSLPWLGTILAYGGLLDAERLGEPHHVGE